MKKLLLGFLLFPSLCFADRLGSLRTNADVLLSTQTTAITTVNSSFTVNGANGALIKYQLNVGSITGAGLATCGDGTHALNWTSSTNLFGCQSITGTGGSGGTFGMVAVGTGNPNGYSGVITSSSTVSQVVLLDSNTFTASFRGGTTTFVGLNPSSVTLQGPITAASLGAITGNQNITLSGDSTGAGTTAITVTNAAEQDNITTLGSSVTFKSAVVISSGLITNASIITSTTTLTSSMTVVFASCTTRGASPTAWITVIMPPATLINGTGSVLYNIYDVGADSCSIRIAGNGTDLIESSGVVRLDAQSQHVAIRTIGAGLWGGDIQYTPLSLFTTQDDVGTFTVGTSSDVYSCPIYIPVPIGFMGVRLGRSTGAGFVGTALTDMNGKYVIGVSSMITISGQNNYMTGGVFQLAPGSYRAELVIPNTVTTINGSNSVSNSKAFCSKVGTSTTGSDLSGFVPTLPGTGDTRPYPAFDLIFNGGMQTY